MLGYLGSMIAFRLGRVKEEQVVTISSYIFALRTIDQLFYYFGYLYYCTIHFVLSIFFLEKVMFQAR
jgi:hypothetical protein